MVSCPECHSLLIKKDGWLTRTQMTKSGKRDRLVQMYRCHNGHRFSRQEVAYWSDSFIEYVVYIYLRCLSLNTTIDIIRATFDEDVLTKRLILDFIEVVADTLPSSDEIDYLYHPHLSGYLAFDGVWFNFQDEQVVLLVGFDPVTFDVVGAVWHEDEDSEGYTKLIDNILNKIPVSQVKGIYGDGDKGLMKSLKLRLPQTPFQLCVVHKDLKMGKLVPIKSVNHSRRMSLARKQEITAFAHHFEACLYADTKRQALEALLSLKRFITSHSDPAFQKAFRALKYNFTYTLTHFDHPEMMRDNNLLECFNGCLKPRLQLMKSFKKRENLNRYLNLFILEYRFRPLRESRFKQRRGKTPLELSGVTFDRYYNFINLLRTQLKLKYQLP